MWAGRLVHEAIERVLLAVRDGYALSEASLIEATVRQMREEWKGSRAGVYREAPRRTGLFEHEYGVPVKDGEWQALRDHMVRCLRNFHRLPLLADIKATPTERWIMIEDIGSFAFEGTTVFAAPDFGYWNAADRLQLVDWKTGGGGGGAALQLGGYALYALDAPARGPRPRGPPRGEPARGRASPRTRAIRQPRPGPRQHPPLGALHEGLPASDPERRTSPWRRTSRRRRSTRLCRWCNFRGVCRPELPPFDAARGRPARAGRLVKALLVDLDDTLLDYTSGIEGSWREACEAIAGAVRRGHRRRSGPRSSTARRWFWDDAARQVEGRRDMVARVGRRSPPARSSSVGAVDAALARAIAEDYAERRRAAYLPAARRGRRPRRAPAARRCRWPW